tara:strand:- start:91918 stop:92097 length:180 start_codon:yes stop_codon:yes gene_type:complete
MLFLHVLLRAASRACWTAGSKSAIKIAMIEITTKSSISVNPFEVFDGLISFLLETVINN